MPALATATSSPPKRSTVSATAAIIATLVGDVGGDPDRPRADPLRRLARLARRRGRRPRPRRRADAAGAPSRSRSRARRRSPAPPFRSGRKRLHAARPHHCPPPRITRSCPASARRPQAVLSRAGGAGAGALARARRLRSARSPTAQGPRSGASTRARRPPTAGPAPTTSSPASSRTSSRATRRCAATGCRARRAGTATGCRSSSRSKSSSASPPSRRSRSTASPSSTQRCRESVFEYVEEWNRLTERIGFWIDLDDPYVTLDNDYIESVWWSLKQLWDDGPPLRGPQGRPLLPALRHRALLARGRARLQGRRGPLHLRALPAARRAREPAGRVAAGLDDDALDAAGQRRGRGRPRRSPTCGRGSTARR